MTQVDKNTIREALRKVIDPELNANVVDLNMIREIDISEKGEVTIYLVLTAPGCPLKDWISQQIYNEVMALQGVKQVEVKILDEPWSPDDDWKSWLNNQF